MPVSLRWGVMRVCHNVATHLTVHGQTRSTAHPSRSRGTGDSMHHGPVPGYCDRRVLYGGIGTTRRPI